MKTLIPILILALILTSCNIGIKQKIKKDLNSRYTGYEIVEIKKDSSFVSSAFDALIYLKLRAFADNKEISKSIIEFENGTSKRTGLQTYQYIDSVYKAMTHAFVVFEEKKHKKVDPCFYVKYRVFQGAIKVERVEYYQIRKDVLNKNVLFNRPYDWDEFLHQQEYDEMVDNVLQYTDEIMDYRYKYTGDFL